MPLFIMAQDKNENNFKTEFDFSGGAGYMMDNSGDGSYQYLVASVNFVKKNFLIGPFANFTNVNVLFGGYTFKAQEYTIGPNFAHWGKLSKNYGYSMWIVPGIKYFNDYGKDASGTQEAWQKDIGIYAIAGANFDDKKNRWFRSYKIQFQYQDNYWSDRTGIWHSENITDSINFKAVNKRYFKTQFEVAVKKIALSERGRLEPKIVISWLEDSGSKKTQLETGAGVAVAFNKGERFFEVFNLQYRARYGVDLSSRLDLIELNLNFVNLIKFIKN